jgi:hypothetical protein
MKRVILLSMGVATATFGCLLALTYVICGSSAATYMENMNRYSRYMNDSKESDA